MAMGKERTMNQKFLVLGASLLAIATIISVINNNINYTGAATSSGGFGTRGLHQDEWKSVASNIETYRSKDQQDTRKSAESRFRTSAIEITGQVIFIPGGTDVVFVKLDNGEIVSVSTDKKLRVGEVAAVINNKGVLKIK